MNDVQTAQQLREKGNALYKTGKLTEAIKTYQDAAHQADENDYLPWSNLSAAYFEIGDYKQSVRCALRALSLCKEQDDESNAAASSLEQKLAPRMLRAYLHTHQYDMARAWLKRLNDLQQTTISPSSSPVEDLRSYQSSLDHAEVVWKATPDEKRHRLHLAANVPRYRPAFARYQEFYNIGHDEVTDLLDRAVHANIKKDISIFFGGIGDARHFYAQLAILGATERAASHAAIPIKRRYHFTMNDSKSGVFARNIILFVMLDELAVSKEMPQTERTEIYTVVYYLFLGVIIPRFAVSRLNRTIDMIIEKLEQKDGETVLPWLRIYDTDRPDIVRALKSWKSGGPLTTQFPTGETVDKAVFQLGQTDLTNKMLYGLDARRGPPGCQKEFKTYFEAPFLQPPRSVLKEHEPELLRLLDSEPSVEKLRNYLTKHWSTNPTLLDEDWHIKARCDLDVAWDPFEFYQTIYSLLSLQEKGGPRKTKLFDYVSSFFQMVVVALRKIRGRLMAEFILDDVATAIDGIRHGLIEERDSTAPNAFDLVHLSNVPDYIGGSFFTFVTASKILNDPQTAKLMSTCLRNTGLWRSHEEFHSEYMAVSDMKMLSKTTQMKMTGKEDNIPIFPMSGYTDWKRERMTPFPYEFLLPRAELTRFLYTHFFKLALPWGRSLDDHEFIHFIYPTLNLTNFFRLLIHLHEIGYPSHWLSDVLGKILDDQVITTARPPRELPQPPEEITRKNTPAKLCVAMYNAEMSTLTVLFQRLLPFTPLLTTGISRSLPSLDMIYEYSIRFNLAVPPKNGEPAAMVLIFFNSNIHMPGFPIKYDLDPSPEPSPSSSSSSSSSPSELKRFRENGCIVITTFKWSGFHTNCNAKFWMREDVMDRVRRSSSSSSSSSYSGQLGWCCGLWRVDDWMLMSMGPEDASSLVKGRKWGDDDSSEDVDMMDI